MKLIIADDEPLARGRLRELLADQSGIEVIAEAENGLQVLEACARARPDAVLLDIAMPGMDGMEAAKWLAEQEPSPAVVFCTAYDQHALAAFEAAAIDYLVKPVRKERLLQALERIRLYLAGREAAAPARRTHLQARLGASLRLIPMEEVYYLQAQEKYVVIRHARGEDVIEESLKSLEDEFGDILVRIHRNCLVARKELVELRRMPDGHVQARLRHVGQSLEVSRRAMANLREMLDGR
ncbi:MAG: LytTR family DNA-binding domain-containing protein [Xanthomonadaceae bacterium]|jgi:two-component system response regulator AlgR|nr:LytTR family DNA-binding domain-containing protein [Xanthomonadaceae bacterium]